MAETTGIQWADRTWSPWHGCAKVSEGCRNCYADKGSKRNPGVLGVWGPRGTRVVTAEASWAKVRRWDREARERGERIRVFPSICDPFEEWTGPMVDAKGRPVPAEGEYGVHRHVALSGGRASMNSVRVRFLRLIEETPNIDWLVLTKRARHMAEWLKWYVMQEAAPLPRNLWGGVSVEDQAAASLRIPFLLRTPLAVRFLSMEPLLSAVNLRPFIGYGKYRGNIAGVCVDIDGNCWHGLEYKCRDCGWGYPDDPDYPRRVPGIDWVIVGGESGKNARPMNPTWARSLRDQCVASRVPFFFKQYGEFTPHHPTAPPKPGREVERALVGNPETDETVVYRVGVEAAGRMLDGREWNEFPTPEVARA